MMPTALRRLLNAIGVLALVALVFGAGAMAVFHQFGGRMIKDFCGGIARGADAKDVVSKSRAAGFNARAGKQGVVVEGKSGWFQCHVEVDGGKVTAAHVYLVP